MSRSGRESKLTRINAQYKELGHAQFIQTYCLKRGLKKFGKRGKDAALKEVKQVHDRIVFKPANGSTQRSYVDRDDTTKEPKLTAEESATPRASVHFHNLDPVDLDPELEQQRTLSDSLKKIKTT